MGIGGGNGERMEDKVEGREGGGRREELKWRKRLTWREKEGGK